MREEEREKSDFDYFIRVAVVFLLIFLVIGGALFYYFYVKVSKVPQGGQLDLCGDNLKNIAIGLEMYSTDYCGDYPPSLDYLTKLPRNSKFPYMKFLPECPTSCAPYGYEVCESPDNYTLWCSKPSTHSYTGYTPKQGCWPQYNSHEGLKWKP